jgi:hypothetical protein
MKRFRWEVPARRTPAPYRDSAVLSAVPAAIFVGVTALAGGDMPLSADSRWRCRQRIREERE